MSRKGKAQVRESALELHAYHDNPLHGQRSESLGASGRMDSAAVAAPDADAPADPPKKGVGRKLYDLYLTTIHTDFQTPRAQREFRALLCPAGAVVQAVFLLALGYGWWVQFQASGNARYLSYDDTPEVRGAARSCVRPSQVITDTFRADTDGVWSSRFAYWAPKGLLEATFFRFNATYDQYDTFGRRLVKRLKEVNAAAANQTLLDALLSYTMARFMVEGFEYQASVAFTGDASVWLDRHEVSSELFSWRELGGRGLIDAKCDVEMLTFVKEECESPPNLRCARAPPSPHLL